ncbi:Ig-like domain-containing protein [Deinococcus fonticola]|uniref:Ig-like domain-containing protein n=1 Tax=Deinococcus fonticola TaxID=2528713 RepID=UPI001074D057|nr:Ig-like domain-containing protein [Deinococcus fonticola]
MKKNVALMALTGILTLASCTQTDPADKTNPVVNLTANPTSLAKEGGTTTLTASASDNVAVTKVEFYRDGAKIGEDTTSPFTYVDTLAANATTSTKSYSYTAKAFDAAANSATSSAVAVTVAATTGGPPPITEGEGYSLAITSPTPGQTVTGNSVQLTYTYSGLTDLQCGVDGSLKAPTNPGSASGACTVDLSGVANGPVKLVVTGKDSKGTVRTAFVTVTKAVTNPTPNITPAFNPEQQITDTAGTNGVDYTKPAFAQGAWRIIPQQIDDSGYTPVVYARGKVWVDAGPSSASRVELWVSNTSNGPARLYLYDGAPKSKAVMFDTNQLNGDQGKVLYLVTRTYSGSSVKTSSFAFIVDNSAAEPADPEIDKGTGTNDRFIRDLRGVKDANWARGTIINYISNNDLKDMAGPLPSGVDRVTFYYVPKSKYNLINALPNTLGRVAQIKSNATKSRAVEAAGPDGKWLTTYDSVAEKDVEGATYYIYAVITDQLGNEVDSTYFQKVSFDNFAPAVSANLRDTSPYPYASCAPTKYISDWFKFDVQGASDKGVGFVAVDETLAPNNVISLDGVSVTLTGPVVNGVVPTIVGPAANEYDSNLVSDGNYKLNARVSDLLGNTVDQQIGDFVIDNTDPAVNFVSPLPGQTMTSGDQVRVNAQVTETGAGVDPNRTVMMWNDYANNAPSVVRTRANGYIGAPVEFAKGSDALWRAMAPDNFNQNVDLVNLVVDCAGNATIGTRTVNVNPRVPVSAAKLPLLGQWDTYKYGSVPVYTLPTQTVLHNFFGDDGIVDFTGGVDGLFTADIAVNGTSTRAGSGSNIDTVVFHRQYLTESWNNIVAWQTGKFPDGTPSGYTYASKMLDPTIQRQGNALAATRGLQWVGKTDAAAGATPLFNMVPTQTSANFYRMTGNYKDLEHGVSGVTGLVTDTFGMYSYTIEEEYGYSVKNTTNATTLAGSYTAGISTVKLDFSVATYMPLTEEAAVSGYHLQGSTNGTSFVDLDPYTTWDKASIPAGTSDLRVTYSVPETPKYTYFRLKLSSGADVFYSQVFTLNVQ